MAEWYGKHWIRDDLRLAILDRDEWSCVYCGATDHLSLDHLVPRSKNGHNRPTNLITACKPCNQSKGDKPWKKFVKDPAIIKKVNRFRKRGVKQRRKFYKTKLIVCSYQDIVNAA